MRDIDKGFPGRFIAGETLPFDTVLPSVATLPTIDNFFHLVLDVVIDNKRSGPGVRLVMEFGRGFDIGCKEQFIEHVVNSLPLRGNFEFVCPIADLACDSEWPISLVIKFLTRSC